MSTTPAEAYHKWFYDSHGWSKGAWCGNQVLKSPTDLILLQEIIYTNKPQIIVETGTWCGGSALFMAMVLDQLGEGWIISIDTSDTLNRPTHPRIQYLKGDSSFQDVGEYAQHMEAGIARTMVVLDSDHHYPHVLKELQLWAPKVTRGQYLVVEDTNLNGHPVQPGWGKGPGEAAQDFFNTSKDFKKDTELLKKYGFSFNSWYQRVS